MKDQYSTLPGQELVGTLVRLQDGALDPAELESLEHILEKDGHARQQFIELQLMSMVIHDHFRKAAYGARVPSAVKWHVRPMVSRLVATAAGMALGICCASLVFAYATPRPAQLSTLLLESFEAGPAPRTDGVPPVPDVWGGDYVEIVGSQAGVEPAHGRRMVRFLRGDHEGMPLDDSRGSHTFRMFDVRGLRDDLRQDTAIVQLSALFNTGVLDGSDPVTCALSIFALDEQAFGAESLRLVGALSRESLAMATSSEITLDQDPRSWQRVSGELRLPPETDYVMIRVGVSRRKGAEKPGFPAHYADDVRLILGHRPELALR